MNIPKLSSKDKRDFNRAWKKYLKEKKRLDGANKVSFPLLLAFCVLKDAHDFIQEVRQIRK